MVHPGYAKGKMVNSIYLAQKFIQALPAQKRQNSPMVVMDFTTCIILRRRTDRIYVIRDHDTQRFQERKQLMHQVAQDLNKTLGVERVSVEIKDQYFNMRKKIEPMMHIVDLAKEAMKAAGITPIIKPIRGGTDGSQLSFMGLPCPNIFAGGHNFHGRYEYVPVESMLKATEVVVNIAQMAANTTMKTSGTPNKKAFPLEAFLLSQYILLFCLELLTQFHRNTGALKLHFTRS